VNKRVSIVECIFWCDVTAIRQIDCYIFICERTIKDGVRDLICRTTAEAGTVRPAGLRSARPYRPGSC